MERRLSVDLAAPRARRRNPLSPSRRVRHERVTASERPSLKYEPELTRFATRCNPYRSRRWSRRQQVPFDGRFRVFGTIARPARLVLHGSRERREKIMNLILLVVVLVLLFGGGGYYWNSRRG
jgi:hypothetical protein